MMGISWQIQHHAYLRSTQDTLKERVAQNAATEGLVITADEQTGGHGRYGREWVSPAGNLYFSCVLVPDCRVQDVGQLGIVMGLALTKAIAELVKRRQDVMLKWPNDVLLDGKKCAGILIERQGDAMIIGMGVNLAHAPEYAQKLYDYTEEAYTAQDVLAVVLRWIATVYGQWIVGDFAYIRADWLKWAHAAGTSVQVKLPTGTIGGHFENIDEMGAMVIKTADGMYQTITAGEVYI